MVGVQRVLVDANVVYSRTLRDWLCLLYLRGGRDRFQVYWTEDIMAEVLYNLRRKNPFWNEVQIGGIRRTIVGTFGDHAQIVGYSIDRTVDYPDVFDAHVHSAAILGGVDVVLTANHDDFEFPGSDDLAYEVFSADSFFALIDDSAPALVRAVVEEQLVYWVKRKGKSLPQALRSAGAPVFADRVRQHLQTVDVAALFSA